MRVRVFVAGLQLRRCLQRLREGAALCEPCQIKSHHNSIARMCTEKAGVTVDDDMISDFHRKIGVGVGCNAFVVGIFAVGSRPDPPPHLWLIIHSGRGSKLRNTVRPERLGVAGWNGPAYTHTIRKNMKLSFILRQGDLGALGVQSSTSHPGPGS